MARVSAPALKASPTGDEARVKRSHALRRRLRDAPGALVADAGAQRGLDEADLRAGDLAPLVDGRDGGGRGHRRRLLRWHSSSPRGPTARTVAPLRASAGFPLLVV